MDPADAFLDAFMRKTGCEKCLGCGAWGNDVRINLEKSDNQRCNVCAGIDPEPYGW